MKQRKILWLEALYNFLNVALKDQSDEVGIFLNKTILFSCLYFGFNGIVNTMGFFKPIVSELSILLILLYISLILYNYIKYDKEMKFHRKTVRYSVNEIKKIYKELNI